MSRGGDREVDSYGEASDLLTVHGFSGLLGVAGKLEVDEGKASGSLGGTVEDNVYLVDLAVLAKLPL